MVFMKYTFEKKKKESVVDKKTCKITQHAKSHHPRGTRLGETQTCQLIDQLQRLARIINLFDLNFYVPSTIFQLYRDGSSWVEPVLS